MVASLGLFVVGAALVVAVAAFLDRRVPHQPPLKRPSPWLGLLCVLVGAWGTILEYSMRRAGVAGMTCSALWGMLTVFGAIRLSQSIGWRPSRGAKTGEGESAQSDGQIVG
jgi:hypothetical protein